jgi:hypothetical protein
MQSLLTESRSHAYQRRSCPSLRTTSSSEWSACSTLEARVATSVCLVMLKLRKKSELVICEATQCIASESWPLADRLSSLEVAIAYIANSQYQGLYIEYLAWSKSQ